MKKQGQADRASVPLPSQTGGSSVPVYHQYQKHPGNVHATENGCNSKREPIPTKMPNYASKSQERRDDDDAARNESLNRLSTWTLDSSSQVYLGPDDNSTDPHETLTETSTLTFVDAHAAEDLAESHGLHEVATVYLKEFVLIDDDDDGDMSLREKTVHDATVMDGRAADLVRGRLSSTSSASLSERKGEAAAPEPPQPEEGVTPPDTRRRCCLCTLL